MLPAKPIAIDGGLFAKPSERTHLMLSRSCRRLVHRLRLTFRYAPCNIGRFHCKAVRRNTRTRMGWKRGALDTAILRVHEPRGEPRVIRTREQMSLSSHCIIVTHSIFCTASTSHDSHLCNFPKVIAYTTTSRNDVHGRSGAISTTQPSPVGQPNQPNTKAHLKRTRRDHGNSHQHDR